MESGKVRKGFLQKIRQTNFDPATGGFWSLEMTALAWGDTNLPWVRKANGSCEQSPKKDAHSCAGTCCHLVRAEVTNPWKNPEVLTSPIPHLFRVVDPIITAHWNYPKSSQTCWCLSPRPRDADLISPGYRLGIKVF